jgi:hypothetical protein
MRFASGHSIFWRLSDDSGDGSDVVSVVLANQNRQEIAEVEIETDIISSSQESPSQEYSVDIEWNRSDLDLFLTLLKNTLERRDEADEVEQIELDLADESVLRIMHIVAAARFATPYHAEAVIRPSSVNCRSCVTHQVGERITLETIDGFKPAVIVRVNEDEVVCVLLEQVIAPSGDNIKLERHDLVVIRKEWALPGDLTDLKPSSSDVIH